ncbi:MAG: heparinase II/III family protein, partial [Rhodospirillales bacterium]
PLAGPALNQLDKAIEDQVLADGGHRSRNPSRQLACLRQLLDIRGILAAARVEAPDGLQRGIDRMAPILRLFKMGDGGLAVFNGGSEEEPAEVEAALALAAFKGRALASAPHLGFQRLSAGRLAVVVDAGAPAEAPFDTGAHAGTLAFEASSGRDRLVVNCGTPLIEGPLAEAMRATAAHSALTIDDHNTAEIIDGGGIGRRPGQVTVLRRQHEGALWMETAEDGYKSPPYGLFHRRTFYLAPGGEELRGEDWLTRLPGNDGAARKATARFHLHPLTQASLLSGGKGVLIKLASGQGWRFLVRGGEVTLEESLYLGEPGHRRKAQQIVVTGRVPAISEDVGGTGLKLQWAFHREKR